MDAAAVDGRRTVADPERPSMAGRARTLRAMGPGLLPRCWQRDGTWARILAQLQARADAKGPITWDVNVDPTVCRAHQHAAGAAKRGTSRRSHLTASSSNRPTTSPSPPQSSASSVTQAAQLRRCCTRSWRGPAPREDCLTDPVQGGACGGTATSAEHARLSASGRDSCWRMYVGGEPVGLFYLVIRLGSGPASLRRTQRCRKGWISPRQSTGNEGAPRASSGTAPSGR